MKIKLEKFGPIISDKKLGNDISKLIEKSLQSNKTPFLGGARKSKIPCSGILILKDVPIRSGRSVHEGLRVV